MRVLTNFAGFPTQWTSTDGHHGTARMAADVEGFLGANDDNTVWLVNCDPHLTMQLALRKRQARLVAVDLVLRVPRGVKGQLRCALQRALFSRVDLFVHYFRDVAGLTRFYGIRSEKSAYVPFKVNIDVRHQADAPTDGEYALCLGRSLRDFDSFFAAMEQLSFAGAITTPDRQGLLEHGSRFSREVNQLPSNVRILPDDGSAEAMLTAFRGARLVVIPTLKASLVASGISTALNAMSLGKCVVGTHGPGMADVFDQGEILLARPEDPRDLARCLLEAWENRDLRERTATAGLAFAGRAGDTQALYRRLMDLICANPIPAANRTIG